MRCVRTASSPGVGGGGASKANSRIAAASLASSATGCTDGWKTGCSSKTKVRSARGSVLGGGNCRRGRRARRLAEAGLQGGLEAVEDVRPARSSGQLGRLVRRERDGDRPRREGRRGIGCGSGLEVEVERPKRGRRLAVAGRRRLLGGLDGARHPARGRPGRRRLEAQGPLAHLQRVAGREELLALLRHPLAVDPGPACRAQYHGEVVARPIRLQTRASREHFGVEDGDADAGAAPQKIGGLVVERIDLAAGARVLGLEDDERRTPGTCRGLLCPARFFARPRVHPGTGTHTAEARCQTDRPARAPGGGPASRPSPRLIAEQGVTAAPPRHRPC